MTGALWIDVTGRGVSDVAVEIERRVGLNEPLTTA